jgi:hypothetical protein
MSAFIRIVGYIVFSFSQAQIDPELSARPRLPKPSRKAQNRMRNRLVKTALLGSAFTANMSPMHILFRFLFGFQTRFKIKVRDRVPDKVSDKVRDKVRDKVSDKVPDKVPVDTLSSQSRLLRLCPQ